MKCEIPEFRKCCFCLPLRYGLLAWGYFKMIADMFLILMSFIFLNTSNTELIILIITVTLFFTDFIVTVVFIVGGHKKNEQLLRVCYFLSMGIWVATSLLACFIAVTILLDALSDGIDYFSQLVYVLIPFIIFFMTLAVQAYFLLLLRSEIIELRNINLFKLIVNHAAEAECTMRCEEVTVATEAKNVQLIRVFYFLSLGMWVATFLLASYTIVTTLDNYFTYNHSYTYLGNVLMPSCFYFVTLAVQTYILVLLRSEIIKLRNSGEFRFVNNAAEAECSMRCEEIIVATEAAKPNN